ncbi:hypothetical protein GCM10009602_04810 [Nocardiopsis tropica]
MLGVPWCEYGFLRQEALFRLSRWPCADLLFSVGLLLLALGEEDGLESAEEAAGSGPARRGVTPAGKGEGRVAGVALLFCFQHARTAPVSLLAASGHCGNSVPGQGVHPSGLSGDLDILGSGNRLNTTDTSG